MAASSNSTPAPEGRASGPSFADDAGGNADLDATYARYLVSLAVAQAADDEADRIEDALPSPDLPAAVLVRPGDDAFGLSRWVLEDPIAGARRFYESEALKRTAHLIGLYNPGEAGYAAGLRAREILAGLQQHREASKALVAESGLPAAQEAARQAWEANRADREALASAQASTLREVLLKAHAVAKLERDDIGLGCWAEDVASDCPGSSTALAVSLTLDLIRMNSAV